MTDSINVVLDYINNNFQKIGLDKLNHFIDKEISGHAILESASNLIVQRIPVFKLPIIKTLELANVSGNLTQKLINKYRNNCHQIIATILVESEEKKIVCSRLMDLLYNNSKNVKISIIVGDFLDVDLSTYNIVVGVPEIRKVSGETKKALSYSYSDPLLNNTFGFSIYKSLTLAKNYISLTIPKYFLHNAELASCRHAISKHKIDQIIDFGELAFTTMGIEFINLNIIPHAESSTTKVLSLVRKKEFIQKQNEISSPTFPSWVIYIDTTFIDLAKRMEFNLFDVFRDRQITNSLLLDQGDIPVLRTKNAPRHATSICTSNDDKYILKDSLKNLAVAKFIDRDDVYVCPNMSPYPRVLLKPKGYIASGSLAIFIPKEGVKLSQENIDFFASSEFESFYKTARNYGTRSLNLDKVAVFYFGKVTN